MTRRLMFNVFTMNTISQVTQGTWRHPDNTTVAHNDLQTWTDLARLAESGCFDAIFLADGAGMAADYNGSWDIFPERGLMFPISDPAMLIPAMAGVTENLGFIYTHATIQQPPYSFARAMSTLDHLTRGRIGWNVVTSGSANAHRNVGIDALPSHEERYGSAEEYLEVVYKLWEGSWDDGAVLADRERGIYADPSCIRKINHAGRYYSVEGPHQVEPSPQRTPVLFQAGGSEIGRNFGARHGEGIFVMSDTPEDVAPVIADMRRRVVAAGRSADDVRFFQGMTFVVGSTTEEARRKEAEYDSYLDMEAAMAYRGGWMGIDFATVDPDTPLRVLIEQVTGIRGPLQQFIDKQPAGSNPTVRDLASFFGAKYRITGTPESIADELERWQAAGVDGFNIIHVVTPSTYADFIEQVVPVLQARGLMQREYAPGTLRDRMLGRGDHLAHGHVGRTHRSSGPA